MSALLAANIGCSPHLKKPAVGQKVGIKVVRLRLLRHREREPGMKTGIIYPDKNLMEEL
jgi:hypothetical protein